MKKKCSCASGCKNHRSDRNIVVLCSAVPPRALSAWWILKLQNALACTAHQCNHYGEFVATVAAAVLFCFCCVERSQSHTISDEHILCAHHQIKCFARNVIEIAYKIITTAAMKWHNVSSAIWKWVSKIKCITIGIIVSFWAQTHTPLHPQKHINSYVSICSLCSFYWRSIFSYTHIENTDEHMNKLLLFSAAINTAESHGDSNE